MSQQRSAVILHYNNHKLMVGEFPVTASSTESQRPNPLLKIICADKEGKCCFFYVLGECDNLQTSDLHHPKARFKSINCEAF